MNTETSIELTEDQIEFYANNGYIQIDNILSQVELDELTAITDELNEKLEAELPPMEERGAYDQVFLQVVNAWRRDERFRKFSQHPVLADVARRLLKAKKIRLFHDHLMTKFPSKDGKPTTWHQDFPYWPMNEPGAMSIWIPMQDVDLANGCMSFVPGSHAWDINETIDLSGVRGDDIFEQVKDKPAHEVQRVYCPLKRGSVTFHDGRTFHYAGKNTSDEPRRVLSIICMPDGTTYDGKPHTLTDGINDLKTDDVFSGDLFPILG